MRRLLTLAPFAGRLPLFPIAGYLISTVCLAMLVRCYVIEKVTQYGPSMYATIPAESNIGIYSRWNRRGKGIKIGDIIQADNPMFVGRLMGKRVIGMPGDYVVLDGDMEATVGGAPVPGIVEYDEANGHVRSEPRMVQVPEGHVWVAGDNFAWSRDSRFYGPVPMALIKGRLLLTFEGITKWKYFGNERLRAFDETRVDESIEN